LVWAVSRDDAEMVDLLLRARADVKGANEVGAPPLYAAASNLNLAMTVKLLAAGADANAALLGGETPLMVAAARGNVEILRALLSAKADPNAKDATGGQTALMWAVQQGHTAVAEELLRGGADVNLGSKTGFTPLMFAAQRGKVGSDGDVDITRILLRAGAKVNDVQPNSKLTALIIASAMVHTKLVELLLNNGADPNAMEEKGFTSLARVVRDSRYGIDFTDKDKIVTIVNFLLAHGADPNFRVMNKRFQATNDLSLTGATPLLLAAEVSNTSAVKALLEAGADPRMTTEQGTTALVLAAGGGTDIQGNRVRSPEERAMSIDTVMLLVKHGADVNAAGQFGWTALHAAAYQGLTDVIEFLVSKGADINRMDAFGQTPLSIALAVVTVDIGGRRHQIPRNYRKEAAELLLKLGATPLDRSGVAVFLLQHTGNETLGREATRGQ
jgi:ankyrin repeat protein